ncbi:MAG: ATP-binding cassette domain-containing protein [Pirellula sp.]|jgi:ABC-type multidrug transport system ATPase subunit
MIKTIPQSSANSPSPTDNVVVIENLCRKFGDKTALDQVSLTIPKGCVYGLIGGNGAGKTTLLKHVTGMLAPQNGSVRVFGLAPPRNRLRYLGKSAFSAKNEIFQTGCRFKNYFGTLKRPILLGIVT